MYTAIIIEPRAHPALPFVLAHTCAALPTTWRILVIHGTSNRDVVHETIRCTHPPRFLPPLELATDNLTRVQYNALLTSAAFYRGIPTEMMLIFQTDTLVVEPSLLDQFMEYDYVGAPWRNGMVGNGGLSLRRRSKMMEVCERIRPHECLQDLLRLPLTAECESIRDSLSALSPERQTEEMNEDIFFSFQRKIPLRIPSWQHARAFAVEEISPWSTTYPLSTIPISPVPQFVGIHASWKHLSVEDIHQMVQQYPAIMKLMELNNMAAEGTTVVVAKDV